MYKNRLVCEDTYYVGSSDRRLALFENVYPLNNGVSYNSYLIVDKKTCLLDGVDRSIVDEFVNKTKSALDGRNLDYLVVNHMEPDHSYSLKYIIEMYPEVTLVIDEKAWTMFKNFNNDFDVKNVLIVKEFDSLDLGKHKLTFVFAPMVHWPEVMMTYDNYTETLFSADAFGTFNALSGNLFASKETFKEEFLNEARRYYTNIVGKYGPQVNAILKKAEALKISNICPLHGPIWKQDIGYIVGLYKKWASYIPEVNGVLIVYGTVYGNTEVAADLLANELAEKGVKNLMMYDVSKTDKSYLVSEAFKYSHIIIMSSTYNMGIFTPMEEYLLDLKYHNLQNRYFSIVQNGSWAPVSGKLISDILTPLKGWKQIGKVITISSSLNENVYKEIQSLSNEILATLSLRNADAEPLDLISYGLYALNTKDDKKQNCCIINVVNVISQNPYRILISVNKNNASAGFLKKNGVCNISVLSENVNFETIKRFGFQHGFDIDKFDGFKDYEVAENGVNYLSKDANCYISCKVKDVLDFGSHYGFILDILDKKILSKENSLTYNYYKENIKPQSPVNNVKKGWICKVCGFFYEGETLPKDYICPLCGHGIEDFEKVGD